MSRVVTRQLAALPHTSCVRRPEEAVHRGSWLPEYQDNVALDNVPDVFHPRLREPAHVLIDIPARPAPGLARGSVDGARPEFPSDPGSHGVDT